MSDSISTRLNDHKDDIERLYFTEGLSYQQIADKYGKSREAIRQFLNRNFPDRESGFQYRLEVNKQQRATLEKLEYERRLRTAEPCIICGEPVTRKTGGRGGKVKTCSPEHSRLWVEARYNLDDEYRDRQRLSTAHTVLKYPEKYNASSVQWAQKVVNDDLEAQRRYMIRGSRASDAYERVMQIRREKFEGNGNERE